MSKVWTRTEPKTLRPFFGASDLADALDGAALELKRGDEPLIEPTKVIDAAEMHAMDPTLYPHLDTGVLAAKLGHRAKDYELVATLRTPQMMRRLLVGRWPCSETLPDRIGFDPALLDDAKLGGAVEFGVAICLANAAEQEDGWPFSPGSWLSRKDFHIGTDRRQASFAFDLLTEDLIKLRNLSAKTAFVVEIDDLNVRQEEDQPLARVLVSRQLLDAVRAGALPSAAQTVLMSAIVDALVEEAKDEVQANMPVVPGSVLERLLAWSGDGKDPMSVTEFAGIIEDGSRRRALVQHRTDLAAMLEKLR